MSPSRQVEDIESELREVESRRQALLEELRKEKSKTLLPNPALALDGREYPDTAEKRVALFEKLFVARKAFNYVSVPNSPRAHGTRTEVGRLRLGTRDPAQYSKRSAGASLGSGRCT